MRASILDRSREFKRRGQTTPFITRAILLNYREVGRRHPRFRSPIALDGPLDIDVDYRSSSFPVALFNGHLTAANSDVRAGDNADRHASRWTGVPELVARLLWHPFSIVAPEIERTSRLQSRCQKEPRAGKKKIDMMVLDFLQSWLVEGDVIAAMGYISER